MKRHTEIEPFIIPFVQKLKTVSANMPGIDSYCKTYLAHLLKHSRYYIEIYARVLTVLLDHSMEKKSSISMVDYGAGNGLLGIFAKFCGFKKVYINDVNKSFTEAANLLAVQLNIPVDGIIYGDIIAVTHYFNDIDKPTAIAGTDVIEHIYNLEELFSGIKSINNDMVTVFTTAANPDNWFKSSTIKKQQLFDEYTGGALAGHELAGSENSPAFFNIRKSIILSASNSLKEEQITLLAKATRGMIKNDILNAVSDYLINQKIPVPPPHPSNTCDPYTGSWSERLLTIAEYKLLYNRYGFKFEQYNGFYNSYENSIKSFLLKFINAISKIAGKKISAFIILVGFKKI